MDDLLLDVDFTPHAKTLGIDVPTLKAVVAAQAITGKFLAPTKPLMRFERHIFYKELLRKKETEVKQEITKRYHPSSPIFETRLNQGYQKVKQEMDQLVKRYPGLIDPTIGGYKGGVEEYQRLKIARSIDNDLALRACTWGPFRIMGTLAETIGYSSIHEFVKEQILDSEGSVRGFVNYLKHNHALLRALKRKDWEMFAKLYNVANRKYYVDKMKVAYAQFAKETA